MALTFTQINPKNLHPRPEDIILDLIEKGKKLLACLEPSQASRPQLEFIKALEIARQYIYKNNN